MSDNWYGRAMLADMKAAGVPTTDDTPAPERERRVLARGWVGYVGDAPEDDELLLFSVALTRADSEAICDLYGRLPDGYRYVEIVEARLPAGEE